MSLQKITEIVNNKHGKIISFDDDIFSDNKFQCSKGHIFELCNNDIIMGQWCQYCQEETHPIDDVLKELGLVTVKNFDLEGHTYFRCIEGRRKFLIILEDDEYSKALAKRNDYNIIIVLDFNNLKNNLWQALKNNQEIAYLGKKEEKIIITKHHNCDIEKSLENEKGETGSFIKYAPEPYPANMNKAVGYIRVSTAMQVNDGFSLEAQEMKLATESNNRNLYLKALYIDKGISGGSTEKRKALEIMRKELNKGDWIIITSVSRLARNTKDLLEMVEEIEKIECHLIIIDLNLDITSPSGKLILTLMASQAQFERELTSERVKGVLDHLKKSGNLRTKPNFGWKINPDRSPNAPLHIRDEQEQQTIKNIRFLRNKYPEMAITAFTRVLNDSDVEPPRKSKVWYHTTLKTIMSREGIK